jgi:DNA mismatch repair protein MutS2
MIYPKDFEQKIGFDQLRKKLIENCLCGLGIARVEQMQFMLTHDELNKQLQRAAEFIQLIERAENFPTSHYYDVRNLLVKASLVGNFLECEELMQIQLSQQSILQIRNFLNKNKETYPFLYELTKPLVPDEKLIKQIAGKLDDKVQVRDNASQALTSIRKSLRDAQAGLRKSIDRIFRLAVQEEMVPEGASPTIRDGRLVIPLLAEYKRRIKGFIHDESATGQTVYMEPAEALEANNQIRELELAERREIIKILIALTDLVREHIPALEIANDFLGEIDFNRAKAKLAISMQAAVPILKDYPAMQWRQAKHPLLYFSLKGKRDVVPLDVSLDQQNHILLVSGPNAGGKSVCLKTAGLLQYMLQCGLPVPMHPDSTAGIFKAIFIDIGDQQSIENDLSTYSSHLRNMREFLVRASKDSFVLIDELGSGTDPNFGGAIAEAVLSGLLKSKVWAIITTHYYNLKLFAAAHNGIRNAAMRFDASRLEPMYILDIGEPGSSYAIEIARKIGLPKSTIQEAELLLGKELASFDKLVRELQVEKQTLSEKEKQISKLKKDLDINSSRFRQMADDLEAKKKIILEEAKAQAKNLLANTNKEIEKTIRHIRESKAHKAETQKVRKGLQDFSKKLHPPTGVKAKSVAQEFKEGDYVKLVGQDVVGIIISAKGKNAVVQLGELKTTVEYSKLEKTNQQPVTKSTARRSSGISLHEKQSQFNTNLDIRGMRVEEVIPLLDQFMDTAILLGRSDLRILHGKGEGVLRKVVREHLRKYKEVASQADEHIERGGDGVTLVVLK